MSVITLIPFVLAIEMMFLITSMFSPTSSSAGCVTIITSITGFLVFLLKNVFFRFSFVVPGLILRSERNQDKQMLQLGGPIR